MIYVNMSVLLLFLAVGVIRRKRYRIFRDLKLKDNIAKIFYPHAEAVLKLRIFENLLYRLKTAVGKVNPVPQKRVNDMAWQISIKIIAEFFMIIAALNIIFLIYGLTCSDTGEQEKVIYRDGYGGDEISYDVIISDEESSEVFTYEVMPREYTLQEFMSAAGETFSYIEEVVSAENENIDKVKSDLYFPKESEDGVLDITWDTDNTEVINRKGIVNTDIKNDCLVEITARVSYEAFAAERTWTVRVVADTEMTEAEAAKAYLGELEKSERNKESFTLPEQIGNARIEIKGEDINDKICKLLVLFVLAGLLFTAVRLEKPINMAKKRDDILESQYFEFVNRLALLTGAGETVMRALQSINNSCNLNQEGDPNKGWNDEIEILLNNIKSGRTEEKAYAECGRRLGLPLYMRIMSLIGQNIKRGNSNMIEILEKEEREARIKKRDDARKKGEEASNKLLIPMMIMLVVVMAIVMFPAVLKFIL